MNSMPKKLILILILALPSCGGEETEANKETSSGTSITLTQVQTVVTKNCVASGCHASGSTNGDYSTISDDTLNGASFKTRIDGTSASVMPPAGTSQANTFSETDRKILLDYIAQ
jgi:hypothetical protein